MLYSIKIVLNPNEIDFSYLEGKRVLILSDTSYRHEYIVNFIEKLNKSKVYIYISPATTSRFIKLWTKTAIDKNAEIIYDKHYQYFYTNKIDDYEICIILGKKKSKETPILTRLVRDMLLTYKNITIVTEKGIDCDENYTV